MTDEERPVFRIEPFDPAKHDRAAFSCGNDRIDNFLKLSAKKQQLGGYARIFVAVEPGSSVIRGFYSVNMHAIEMGELPPASTRHAPRHGHIPAAYLSMIAVDRALQGRKLGTVLMTDALLRLERVAEEVGTAVVVLDVLDDDGPEQAARRADYYRRFGFVSFPSKPLRMFLPMAAVKRLRSG